MVLREFTKQFVQCFVIEVGIEAQDYVLGTLVEHAKKEQSGEAIEPARLYCKFDS